MVVHGSEGIEMGIEMGIELGVGLGTDHRLGEPRPSLLLPLFGLMVVC